MTHLWRTPLVLLLGAGALVVGAAPVSAHAALLATDPQDGTVLAVAPASLTLRFNEPVATALGAVRVVDPAGERVDDGRPALADGGRTVTVALPGASAVGTYVLSWRVVSEDAHAVSGASTFSVGAPSKPATAVAVDDGPAGDWLTGFRGVAYAGLLLLVGVVALLLVVWPAGLARAGARRLAWTGWGLTVAGSAGTLLLQGPSAAGLGVGRALDGSLLSEVLTTDYGRAHVVRLGLLAVAAAGLVALSRGRVGRVPALVLGVLLAATWPVAGHAAAGDLSWLALPADALHLLAVGVWTGGLAVLGLVLLRRADLDASVLHRWSRLATGAVLVMVATGSFAAWREVRSVDALTTTRYGDLLLVKVALVLAMLGLGALGRRWVRRSSPALLRRGVLLEAGVAAAVVGTTAVLVQTPPARTAYAAPITVRTDLGPAGAVQVELDSARVGLNTLHVYLTGAGGRAVDVAEVTARLTRSDGQSASAPVPRGSLGHYETTRLAVPFRGAWRLDVAVRTSDVDVSTASVTTTFR